MYKKASELPISIYFMLEGIDNSIIADFPGKYDSDSCDFEDLSGDLVYKYFTLACDHLMPLLEGVKFNSLSIGIDVLGFGPGQAGYYHTLSDNESGYYGFSVSPELLSEYLKDYWEEDYQLPAHYAHMWEHELIHLLDHSQLKEILFNESSTDRRELFIHYLLKFRNEGIANIFELCHGRLITPEIESAVEKFKEIIIKVEELDWENHIDFPVLKNQLLSNSLCYSIGPWMVLNAICLSEDEIISQKALDWKTRIENKEVIPDAEIMEMIELGIQISNDDFLDSLTAMGKKGIQFIPSETFYVLTERISRIKDKRTIPMDDEKYNGYLEKIIGLFERIG